MPENTPKSNSVSERGHAKFMESLDRLIAVDATLDAAKLNAPADLTSAALAALRTKATADHAKIGVSRAEWRTAAQERQADADEMDSTAAQAVALLEALGASAETVEDARSYVRKLRGDRANPLQQDNPLTLDVDESESGNSTSQQSNAARIATFTELIDFLDAQTIYKDVANADLNIDGLRAFVAALDVKHQASITAATAYDRDLGDRNGTFYNDDDSILNRVKRYKKLVFATYSGDSEEYQSVNEIPFQKP